jgi:exodeoxyribonuclease-3
MKLVSWNVNGIRAILGKDFIYQFKTMNADVFCLQETKAQEDQIEDALKDLKGYYIYSNSAEKKGYSGVSIISKTKPKSVVKGIGIEAHDQEGRVLTAEYEDLYLVVVYTPNSGEGLKRLEYRSEWDNAFAKYIKKLKKSKPVITVGDFNVAHKPIDLARPKENYNKTSGYTQVEIDGMDLVMKTGLIDAFRILYPEKVQYSFWSVRFGARAKNVGWRIDYFLVDELLKNRIIQAEILDQEMGSDHCPITLTLS